MLLAWLVLTSLKAKYLKYSGTRGDNYRDFMSVLPAGTRRNVPLTGSVPLIEMSPRSLSTPGVPSVEVFP